MKRALEPASLFRFAAGQSVGTNISLDAKWRWTRKVGETNNCGTDETWDSSAHKAQLRQRWLLQLRYGECQGVQVVQHAPEGDCIRCRSEQQALRNKCSHLLRDGEDRQHQPTNQAGAPDGQCARDLKWVNGKAKSSTTMKL